MKANYLVLIVGLIGILFFGYFIVIGKDIPNNLFGFIAGASLIFAWWNFLRKTVKSA